MKNLLTQIIVGVVGCMALNSCQNKDNLTPASTIAISNVQYRSSGATYTFAPVDRNIGIGSTDTLRMTIKINSPAGIKQIDIQRTGLANFAINDNNFYQQRGWIPVVQKIGGFVDSKMDSVVVLVYNPTGVASVSVLVTDNNNIQANSTYTFNPSELSAKKSATLYSNNALVGDELAGQAFGSFHSLFKGLTFDTTTAKTNASSVELSYVDSLGTPFLVSANARSKALSTLSFKDLAGSASVTFANTSLNANTVKLPELILATNSTLVDAKMKVEAGKAYLFKSSNGLKGIIHVNAISPGLVSSNANAKLDLDYIYITDVNK